jgi:serine/threonine protein kinase
MRSSRAARPLGAQTLLARDARARGRRVFSNAPENMPPPLVRDGETIGNRFKIQGAKPIGVGQFAQVFRAIDLESPSSSNPSAVAVKIEFEDKTHSRELKALNDLQGCVGVCDVVASGAVSGGKSPYIVMSLVGENLASVRASRVRDATHTQSTTGWIGAQMLDILRGIHERGYVHRDVKPSNVTLGGGGGSNGNLDAAADRQLFLIDLGVTKKFEIGGGAFFSHWFPYDPDGVVNADP